MKSAWISDRWDYRLATMAGKVARVLCVLAGLAALVACGLAMMLI